MEVNETKNCKALDALADECQKKHDSLFAVFGTDNTDEVVITAVGTTEVFRQAIENIIMDSYENEDNEHLQMLRQSILTGIGHVLGRNSEASNKLADELHKVVDIAGKVRTFDLLRSAIGKKDEFNPFDKDCIECDSYGECLAKDVKKFFGKKDKKSDKE